eukprot:TRINITY_DN9757_c0_g1_i7.p1 TRINITY_DN9757_c0_g1~~TRINITY_DN9757_c0_g1_i7.p1  ORF type:complete len:149 (-),score=20.40 TRINITY_DN9757_c0_g1_i7:586-1032(-)
MLLSATCPLVTDMELINQIANCTPKYCLVSSILIQFYDCHHIHHSYSHSTPITPITTSTSQPKECTRVCITGGTLLFLTLANRIMLRAINQITNLVVVNIHPVFVGGFEANLYHLKKVFHSSGLLLSPGPPASPPLAFSSYQFFFFEI